MAVRPHAFSVVCFAEVVLANIALMCFYVDALAAHYAEFACGFALSALNLM